MQRRPRLFFLALSFLAIIGSLLWLCPGPREPYYKDKPLSFWLNRQPDVDSTNALRAIGTNAIPSLLRMLQTHDSSLRSNLVYFGRTTDFYYLKGESTFHIMAGIGFMYLGADAKEAVPALIQILEQHPSPAAKDAAAWSLASIGQSATNAILPLLRTTTNSSDRVRWSSIDALGEIHEMPDLVVPALAQRLKHDSSPVVRNNAAAALGNFGPHAKSALPVLIEAITLRQSGDASPIDALTGSPLAGDEIRSNALRSISLIAPEIVAQLSPTNQPPQ